MVVLKLLNFMCSVCVLIQQPLLPTPQYLQLPSLGMLGAMQDSPVMGMAVLRPLVFSSIDCHRELTSGISDSVDAD